MCQTLITLTWDKSSTYEQHKCNYNIWNIIRHERSLAWTTSRYTTMQQLDTMYNAKFEWSSHKMPKYDTNRIQLTKWDNLVDIG